MTILETAAAPYLKPLPAINPTHQPFFDALRNHQFVVPKCDNCGDLFTIRVNGDSHGED